MQPRVPKWPTGGASVNGFFFSLMVVSRRNIVCARNVGLIVVYMST